MAANTIGGYVDNRIAELERENAILRGRIADNERMIESLQQGRRRAEVRHAEELTALRTEISHLQRQIGHWVRGGRR